MKLKTVVIKINSFLPALNSVCFHRGEVPSEYIKVNTEDTYFASLLQKCQKQEWEKNNIVPQQGVIQAFIFYANRNDKAAIRV